MKLLRVQVRGSFEEFRGVSRSFVFLIVLNNLNYEGFRSGEVSRSFEEIQGISFFRFLLIISSYRGLEGLVFRVQDLGSGV